MLSDSSASATPGSSADAQSDNGSPGIAWAANTRTLIANKELPPERRRFFEELARFAERTGCAAVTDHEIDLWGYGTLRVVFADNDGNWWASLAGLVEPTGLTFDELRQLYLDDVEDGRDDVEELSWLVSDDDPDERDLCFLEMVGPSFAMRAMLAGPWGREFADALMPTFRRAIVASGLGDKIGPVVRIREDGTTEQMSQSLGDFLARGDQMPTEQEARQSAFRGPLGGAL